MKEIKQINEQINWLTLKLTKAQIRGDKEMSRHYDELIMYLQWVIE
jgi:hypothetical protein